MFTKNIIALIFLLRVIFYSRPTVIYILIFLTSLVLFYKKTSISLSNITKPSLINISLIIVGFLLSFKLKIIPIHRSRWFLLGFWSGSIAIRYVSYHFQNLSVPTPLRYEDYSEKNSFQWKQKAYPISKL